MLLPVENYIEWAEKYGLRIVEAKCPKCQADIVTNLPFALGGYRGLKSADHGCGEMYTRKIMVAVSKEELAFWANIARDM